MLLHILLVIRCILLVQLQGILTALKNILDFVSSSCHKYHILYFLHLHLLLVIVFFPDFANIMFWILVV